MPSREGSITNAALASIFLISFVSASVATFSANLAIYLCVCPVPFSLVLNYALVFFFYISIY